MDELKPLLCPECTHDIDLWHNEDGCQNACHCKLNKTEALYQLAQQIYIERDALRSQLEVAMKWVKYFAPESAYKDIKAELARLAEESGKDGES